MDPQPVQHYATPKYPTRRDLMLGAAGFVLIELFGDEAKAAESDRPAAGRTVVAPIFKHGEGRGATGCIVIAPPVFLSEEEAMQIIREELTKHGVKLGDPMTLADVTMTVRYEHLDIVEKGGKEELKRRIEEATGVATEPLKLGGVDRTKKVAVLFVSEKAYHDLGGPMGFSTVRRYDFAEVAEYVAAHLKKQSKADICVGLLYDPAVSERRSFWETETRAKAKAIDLLRQQTHDFAAWLKQRKVL